MHCDWRCNVHLGCNNFGHYLSMSDFLLCSLDPSTKLQTSVSTDEQRVIPESKAFMAGVRGEQRREHRSQRLVEYVKYQTFSGYQNCYSLQNMAS